MADQFDELRKALSTQQALHRAAVNTILEDLHRVTDDVKRLNEDSSKILSEKSKESVEYLRVGWRGLVEMAVRHFKDKMAETARTFGGPGGLGDIGTKFGKTFGAKAGEMLGGMAGGEKGALIGKQIGGITGAAAIDALQAMESYRILGARMVQVFTAGHYFRSDFMNVGGNIVQQVINIQKETGAARQEIFSLADQLSKLGIPFDMAGMRGTKYLLAAEKIFNLQEGLIYTLTDTAIRRYGESWETIGTILEDTAEATSAWRQQTEDLDKSTLKNIASTNILSKMYSQLAMRMKDSGLEMAAMNKIMLASVGVMGQMGMRPGQMQRIISDFVSALSPNFSSFDKTLESSFWYNRLLNFSERGREFSKTVMSFGLEQGIPRQMFSLALQQYISKDESGEASLSLFANLLEGIAAEQSSLPGTKEQQYQQMSYMLNKAFDMSPYTSFIMSKFGELIREARASGLTDRQAFEAVAKNPEFEVLRQTVGAKDDASVEAVLGMALIRGKGMLSVEQEISLAVEGISAWAASWGKLGEVVSIIGEHVGPNAAATGHFGRTGAQERLAAIDRAMEKAGLFGQGYQGPPMRPPLAEQGKKTTIGGITKSTAQGVVQETWYVYDKYIEEFAEKYDIDPELAKRQMRVESRGSGGHAATSPVGAMGLAQIMPETWPALARKIQGHFPGEQLDPYNPRHSAAAGMALMRENLDRFKGDYDKSLAAYHGGLNRAAWGPRTREYVRRCKQDAFIGGNRVRANLERKG